MPGRKYMIETDCFFSVPSNLKLSRFVFFDVVNVFATVVFMSFTMIDRTSATGSKISPSSVRRMKFAPLIVVRVCSLVGTAAASRLTRLDTRVVLGFALDD